MRNGRVVIHTPCQSTEWFIDKYIIYVINIFRPNGTIPDRVGKCSSPPKHVIMKTIRVRIRTIITLEFQLISFNPEKDIARLWAFGDKTNGPLENDGITAFKRVIAKAATLPREEGYKLLFATGLVGTTWISLEDRIRILSARAMADPNLLWSLYKEKGQKTLRYLYNTYGVTWMESLRRCVCFQGGNEHTLHLFRKKGGRWDWDYFWGEARTAVHPALVLGA